MAIKEITYKDGTRLFRIDFRDQSGRRVRECGGRTLRAARTLLEQRRVEVRQGTYVNPNDAGEHAGPTFGEFAKTFLAEYASERRSTYYADTIMGRRPDTHPKGIIRFFRDYPLAELEDDWTAFDRYRRQRLGEGLSPGTVRKELLVLNVMFKEARRRGLVDRNPLADVDRPRETRGVEVRPLSREEIERTIAELESSEPWLAPIFRFALATGARLKEAALMTWDRIDREAAVVWISGDNKTGVAREVPLGRVAAEAIDAADDGVRSVEGYVFLDEQGQPLTDDKGRNRISQRTAAAMRRAGVEGASFKSVRTTIGTELVGRGFSDALVGELLGHAWAKQNVTGRYYVRVRVEHLRPLVEAFDRWISNGLETDTKGVATGTTEEVGSNLSVRAAGVYLERETGIEPATLSLGS